MTLPLLHLAGATEGTTQWKAEVLQMVNWGGFHGHTQMRIAPGATLLSGASGTGKSTLLDAYLALMMPSDTPFNGASNDATTGRARSMDQRNLMTYLRGKTDMSREAGTDELQDQVLRGSDGPTWGALAMTFVDDNSRRYTALRVYFVPAGATRSLDISMKMAAIDRLLDLRDLAELAATRFDKRALKARFPGMEVFDTYSGFAQTLHTRLGIGAGGDGGKALRLLARIQAGQPVSTVDGLFKSTVLETPSTYAAADRALAHFADLETSYEAMLTLAQKEKVLGRLPDLHTDLERARSDEEMVDSLGARRSGDSPFVLWRSRTEKALLDRAIDENRLARRAAEQTLTAAQQREGALKERIEDVKEQQRQNGGGALDRLGRELEQLAARRDDVLGHRSRFDAKISPLGLAVGTSGELAQAQALSVEFLESFETLVGELEQRLRSSHGTQWPLENKLRELRDERDSLSGRDGLVPKMLHEVRLAIARASGFDPAELPYLAELIDLAPGEEQWRKAVEVTLFAVARVLLVDERRLDQLSRAIDPLRLPVRVNFEGVTLRQHEDFRGDQQRVSGKLVFKDSLFSRWAQDRVQQPSTDALCVQSPAELGGGGARVTVSGQTRNGRRGAHGESGDRHIIGFSNKARLEEIAEELAATDQELGVLAAQQGQLSRQISELRLRKEAHQHLALARWLDIDVAGVEADIHETEAEKRRMLAANDILAALQVQEGRLGEEIEEARRRRFGAEAEMAKLDQAHDRHIGQREEVADVLGRIAAAQSVVLLEEQSRRLDSVLATVGDPEDLAGFDSNIERLRRRLEDQSQSARAAADRASKSLTGVFETFQQRWPDPNLGTAVESYQGYRDILDHIVNTGLHERRQEWRRRLSEWSGQDLVPLNGAFETSVEEIEERLLPINDILATLPFGAGRDRLKIVLRRLTRDNVALFRRELKALSSGTTEDLAEDHIEARFKRLRAFMAGMRVPESGAKQGSSTRDLYLDVRKHVEITAVRLDSEGQEVSTYSSLGGKSGGETQELVAFIVGAALRFQLGDESRTRPRFAPVFLDEGFVKSDSEFAGRAVSAWKGLGFQLVVGAPLDKVTALEPYMEQVFSITKNPKTGYSYIIPIVP